MRPFQANIINALVLIIIGLWSYFSTGESSPTMLIPVGFGVVFALVTPLFRQENRTVIQIIVLLTFLLIIALFMPLRNAVKEENTINVFRIALMLLTSVFAMVIYIKSFIDARKARP